MGGLAAALQENSRFELRLGVELIYGMSLFVISICWGQFLVYAFIGLVLFVLAGDGPNQTQVMTGFALVFVFMVTPLEGLLINIPRINMARVAASRIDDIT